ncbi:MAG: substrate binding domain-containing protein, partial [Rhodospirillales bacterium]
YRTAHDVFAKLAMVEAQIAERKDRPQGLLKVTTTVAFGSIWLTPRMKEFVGLYPDIDVSVVLADTELDLSMRQADAAIRLVPPSQPDLIQRHLMRMSYCVYAAHEYLEEHGEPNRAEDLDDHQLIVYGDDARPPVENLNWLLEAGCEAGCRRRPGLQVNSIYGIFRAVQSGFGIGALPDYMSREVGNLIEILPELRGPSIDFFFVYPEELRNFKRIGVLRDFLVSKMRSGKL